MRFLRCGIFTIANYIFSEKYLQLLPRLFPKLFDTLPAQSSCLHNLQTETLPMITNIGEQPQIV